MRYSQLFKQAFKNFPFLIIILIVNFFYFNFVHAQTAPQFLVTWQAQNYVPAWYNGRIFPVNGTSISVRFELIDSGKIVNLTNPDCEQSSADGNAYPCRVRWYVNDDLVRNEDNGFGIKALSFVNTRIYDGNDIDVRISIPNYGGQSLDKVIHIPVKSEEVVIDAPYSGNQINKGKNIFTAWPLFFNSIGNFSFAWLVDGQQVGSSSQIFNLNIDQSAPSQTQLSLEAQLTNSQNKLADKTIKLQVK